VSIGPKAQGQKNLTCLVEFFYQYLWMISVDMLVISIVESALWNGAFDLF